MTVGTATSSSVVFGEATASLHRAARYEVVIDRPPAAVWAVLTDSSESTIKSWNPDVTNVMHISGERAQLNELLLVSKNEELKQPPFYVRTIRLVENEQRVLRCDAADGSYMAFVDHTLYGSEKGRTKLVYSGYWETWHVSVEQIRTFNYAKTDQYLMSYLHHVIGERLKKVVESRPRPQ